MDGRRGKSILGDGSSSRGIARDVESRPRTERERETPAVSPDLNISTRRATFAREGAHGRSLNNFIRAVNTPKIKDRKRHFPAKVICSVS